ncbi:partner and localizer of BRCA2-like isoform X2 [Oncorhynchus keta]|uniref:partner and localizer of BRCA2-like isoform X2 n=1 Tax=Oncorhynchus keta TaxID=8018 RepID=UPI00227C6BBF|nr:partner and localizer of BRCA2-like isoform X2 [Oncorhynchus keta]
MRRRVTRTVLVNRRATNRQITEQNGISERTTHGSLSLIGYCSRRPHRVPLLSAKTKKKRLQWETPSPTLDERSGKASPGTASSVYFSGLSVMSVFPVSDAPGLLCVTLGQLEIREARVLCCSSLSQAVLCEGEIHMVVGMSNRRLVSSSYSVATTPLQVYTLTQDGRLQACLSLVCPSERVQTVAAVEGQTDALIGSTHGGHVVLWNVATGQLLRSIDLGDGFTDTTCLRGYSLCVSVWGAVCPVATPVPVCCGGGRGRGSVLAGRHQPSDWHRRPGNQTRPPQSLHREAGGG